MPITIHDAGNENPLPTPNQCQSTKRYCLSILVHRRGTSLAEIGLVRLGLGNTLGKDGRVLVLYIKDAVSTHIPGMIERGEKTYSLILNLLSLATLERETVSLVLQALGSDKPLDLRSLGVRLLTLALGLDLTTNDILADLSNWNEEMSISV